VHLDLKESKRQRECKENSTLGHIKFMSKSHPYPSCLHHGYYGNKIDSLKQMFYLDVLKSLKDRVYWKQPENGSWVYVCCIMTMYKFTLCLTEHNMALDIQPTSSSI
jgi:hypothetical protein